MEPTPFAAFAERARSLNFAPPCWEALGVERASSLAFEAHWAAADEDESACSTAVPEEPEEPDLAQGIAVTARDLSDALRSCLSDARFRWVTDARQSAAVGSGATFLWDATSRSWADRASGVGGACSAQWGSSFGLSEDWLTSKDALAALLHLRLGRLPWFASTYRLCSEASCSGLLRNELAAFVGHALAEPGAVFIVKPATLSRSRGITVSSNLGALLDACEALVRGGLVCVAQRYVERPLLYRRERKFDLRILVGVRSLAPLRLVVYDHVVCRAAAAAYAADSRDAAAHITVTQYACPGAPLLATDAWARDMEEQGVDVYGMGGVISQCHAAVRDLFLAVRRSADGEPIGVRPHRRVRALYGLDVIIDAAQGVHALQPVILECNYKPDLRRVLADRPRFLDQLFCALFSGGEPLGEPGRRPTPHGAFIALD